MSSQPYPLAFPFLFIFSHLGDWFQVLLITSRKKVLPEMRCFAGKGFLLYSLQRFKLWSRSLILWEIADKCGQYGHNYG